MNQTSKNNQKSENIKDVFVTVYLNDIIKALQRFWWVCIAAAVLFGSYSAINQRINYVPRYESNVTLTVNTQNKAGAVNGISVYSFYYDSTTASLLSTTFPYILNCNLLQEAIREDLGVSSLPAKLSADAVDGTNMFTLTAIGRDPQLTYDVLNSAIENYPSVAKYVVGNITFEILKQPMVATEPSNKPDYLSEALKGAVIGVFFGLLFIFIYILQRKTIKSKTDIKNHLTLEALSVIPQVTFKKRAMPGDKSLLFTNPDIGSSFPESFRVLRNIFISSLEENEKIVMTTSSVPGEGKTTITTNLAISLADHSKNVLIIDGDIRHPSVAPLLGVDTESIEYETVTELYKIAYLEKYKLHILIPTPSEEEKTGYFTSGNIKQMFDSLRDSYDYIIVDTPPCGLISDALFIAQYADAAIFVTYQDAVRISRVKSTLDSLMSTDIHILGCVLNGAVTGLSGYGYGYYGYGYGYGKYGYGYGYGKYGYGYGYGEEKHKKHRSGHKSRRSSKTVSIETPINNIAEITEAEPVKSETTETAKAETVVEKKIEQIKTEAPKEAKGKKNKKKKNSSEPVPASKPEKEEDSALSEDKSADSEAKEALAEESNNDIKAEADGKNADRTEKEDSTEKDSSDSKDSSPTNEKDENKEADEEEKNAEASSEEANETNEESDEEDSEEFSVFD